MVGVLALGQNILVARVVGLLVGHPAARVHADGVAVGDVRMHVSAVDIALIVTALEVPALVEDDLKTARRPGEKQNHCDPAPLQSLSLTHKLLVISMDNTKVAGLHVHFSTF